MKKGFFCLMMIVSVGMMKAETITGNVIDSKGEAMPFVTISVLAQDSTLITGAITDDDGNYEISDLRFKIEDLIIQASYIGYQTAYGGPDFVLREETEQLKEVEVKAKKPLIERQMDKLVVNVSASPLSAGSNGNDILRRAPGVRIDKDGNITVNGKSVEVYVDGKPSYLSGQQLKAMLDGTDGNTIEKIEIISNPSAKYDAAGQGGIINIKTKRNMMQGLNGMLSAAYGGMYFGDIKRWLNMDMVSLNMNYRSEKTYTFGQITQVYAENDVDLETYRSTPALESKSKSGYDVGFQYYMVKVGNDWYIDKKNTLGFILQVPFMDMKQNSDASRNEAWTYDVATEDTARSITDTRTRYKAPQHTANLNYTHTFDEELERELTVNIDYNRYNNQSTNSQYTNYVGTKTQLLDINSKQVANIYSAKLDFQTKFWETGMLECGVKYALSSTDNHMTTDSTVNDLFISSTPSDFLYQEHVAAMYISAGKQFGEHWSVKLGLRGEYTFSHGNWKSADSVTNKSYFDPFPTAYIGYTSSPLGKIGQPISVSASYTRRIRRPNYWMLNPFRQYTDAYSYNEGNTDLKPEYNNDVEINFSWTQYLNMTFNFGHTQDMFSQPMTILPDGMAFVKWKNFGTCTTHGINVSLTELPLVPKYMTLEDGTRTMQGAWLALTVNGGWMHFINKSYEKDAAGKPVYENRNHYGHVGGTLSAYLPKDWTMTLDGNWSSPMTTGYDRDGGMMFFMFGVRKMIMSKGLILNLNVQDLARTLSFDTHNEGMEPGYSSWYKNTVRSQKVMLSVTWMFGQYQQHKNRKVGDMDELDRLGGGGGVKTN